MIQYLIDLDTLLDTRLGVLSRLDKDAAVAVATNPNYWLREHNDWAQLTEGRVTNEAFEAAYLARTKADLQASVMSGIFLVLMRLFVDHNRMRTEGQDGQDVALEVNIHPYELEDEELEELTQILRSLFYPDLPLSFCSRPLEELTPQVLRERYNAVVLYDFHRWIKLHGVALSEHRCPAVSLIAPRLYETNPARLTQERKQEEVTAFRLLMLDMINIDFIDVEFFSMFRPNQKDLTDDPSESPDT